MTDASRVIVPLLLEMNTRNMKIKATEILRPQFPLAPKQMIIPALISIYVIAILRMTKSTMSLNVRTKDTIVKIA